ncbi:MAG TPA: hypothetical protein VKA80_04140, partial [Beijerinckiaceae bacterium]|nr:hypothetical protein [Beijerinckiaceae bacterium]
GRGTSREHHMPLHLHFADPPKPQPRVAPTPQPQASDLRVALATVGTSLAVLAATYWLVGR